MREYDKIFNSSETAGFKKFQLASGHISTTEIFYEAEHITVKIEAGGKVQFLDTEDNICASADIPQQTGGRENYTEILCGAADYAEDSRANVIILKFPIVRWIDNYPHCDGEHDRWDTEVIGHHTLRFDMKTNEITFDKTKVLIMAKYDDEIRSALHEKFGEHCEFYFADDKKKIPEEQLRAAEVIIGEPEEDQLQAAESLKWMQITWAGVNKYSRMKSFPAGVTLTNVSGAFGRIIAEYAVGSMIALYRSFPKYWDNKKAHVWRIEDSALSVYGKKVLILGAGDLGRNVARRLQAFDAHVMGVRRNQNAGRPVVFDEMYGMDDLDRILPQADIVVGCLPDTPETRGLMTFDRLMSMKEKAILINVGRGSLLKNDDLIRVMQSGHLLGAALDVVEGEPLAADSPLWDMENVIITPHISGPSFGGNQEIEHTIWDMCIDNLERYLKGKPLEHEVDLKAGY